MPTTPSVIGRYQIVRVLGTGGMGAVYLARDPELDRPVAIKLVKDALTDDPELRERFSREARSAARLRHPNIITIFDIGDYEGRPFIAMEYVPGESLSDLLRRQPALELPRVLAWMESLCRGLAHAHQAGIVHRDIKPANMMVDPDGTLKIVDFGIARLGDSQLTRDGMLVGTANYMAPEQLLGAHADHRADIFAIGAVFYELLTGRKAFGGTIADGLFNRICYEPPAPLTALYPGLDPEIVSIVDGALDKDPSRRYQDLTTLGDDIGRVRARLFGSAAPPPPEAATSQLTALPGETPRPFVALGTPVPTPLSVSRARVQPDAMPRSVGLPAMPPGATPSPSRAYQPRVEDSPTQRTRQAEIFVDAAEMALRAGDLPKAQALIGDAARFDADAPAVAGMRTQIEQAEREADDAKRRLIETESALSDASGCISRGEFGAARGHLERAAAAGPGDFRVQALWSRLRTAEAGGRERQHRAVDASPSRRGGLPWTPILLVALAIAIVTLYLISR